jgi:hypothetical protein
MICAPSLFISSGASELLLQAILIYLSARLYVEDPFATVETPVVLYCGHLRILAFDKEIDVLDYFVKVLAPTSGARGKLMF